LAGYVLNSLKERIVEVKAMLRAAQSKISVSVDVWSSSNNPGFLGVAANFVGKFFKVSDFPTLSARESSHYGRPLAPALVGCNSTKRVFI
jgi:hypothetical protein